MGWDDGDKNNPWQKNDRGPADLDEIVRDFQRKLAGLFGGGGKRPNGSGGGGGKLAGGAIGGILLIALAAWLVSGVYQVQERERAINDARAEYNRVIPQARGEALRTVEQAEGYATNRVNRARGDAENQMIPLEEVVERVKHSVDTALAPA